MKTILFLFCFLSVSYCFSQGRANMSLTRSDGGFGIDTTANDSATIHKLKGIFKVASGSATFTLINSKILNIGTLTFFEGWNPGNTAHFHIESKGVGVVVIGFDPAPNQDTKIEFYIKR